MSSLMSIGMRGMTAATASLDVTGHNIANANVNTPKGGFDGPSRSYTINANDQIRDPSAYRDAVIAYRNGAPVRLSAVAEVVEGAENTQLGAWTRVLAAAVAEA